VVVVDARPAAGVAAAPNGSHDPAIDGAMALVRDWLESGLLARLSAPVPLAPGRTVHDAVLWASVTLAEAEREGRTRDSAREQLVRFAAAVRPLLAAMGARA
jgi:hypothetical protein